MKLMFWRRQPVETRDLISISDPALAEFFGLGLRNDAGMSVTTNTAMGMTAVYRAVSLIAGTIAGLPLECFRDVEGRREPVPSFLDDPGRPQGMSRFRWAEQLMVYLLLHGDAFLHHRRLGGGEMFGLELLHPSAVTIDTSGQTAYRVTPANGAVVTLTPRDLTHIPALSLDGVHGLSPVRTARQSIGTGLAADKVSARGFGSGFVTAGIVTTEEDVSEEDGKKISASINSQGGHDTAGRFLFVNRHLKFTPWAMNGRDAQFIESRAFQVEEIARLYGLPSILLADSTKTTSWGAGVAEVIRAMAKFTLKPWTDRLEEALTPLLPDGVRCEFNYAGLLQTSQAEVTDNLIKEIGAGLLTVNEARAILNREPLPDEEAAG